GGDRMLIKRIARGRYLRGLAALERGDFDALLAQFDPQCEFVFVGETPLGAHLRSRDELRVWLGKLHTMLPSPRFEIKELVISGWPWDLRLAARAEIHSTMAGQPYVNCFAQFLRLRWGRVVWDYVLEDTQRFAAAISGR